MKRRGVIAVRRGSILPKVSAPLNPNVIDASSVRLQPRVSHSSTNDATALRHDSAKSPANRIRNLLSRESKLSVVKLSALDLAYSART